MATVVLSEVTAQTCFSVLCVFTHLALIGAIRPYRRWMFIILEMLVDLSEVTMLILGLLYYTHFLRHRDAEVIPESDSLKPTFILAATFGLVVATFGVGVDLIQRFGLPNPIQILRDRYLRKVLNKEESSDEEDGDQDGETEDKTGRESEEGSGCWTPNSEAPMLPFSLERILSEDKMTGSSKKGGSSMEATEMSDLKTVPNRIAATSEFELAAAPEPSGSNRAQPLSAVPDLVRLGMQSSDESAPGTPKTEAQFEKMLMGSGARQAAWIDKSAHSSPNRDSVPTSPFASKTKPKSQARFAEGTSQPDTKLSKSAAQEQSRKSLEFNTDEPSGSDDDSAQPKPRPTPSSNATPSSTVSPGGVVLRPLPATPAPPPTDALLPGAVQAPLAALPPAPASHPPPPVEASVPEAK